MLLSLLKLKFKNYEMLHKRKVFEINKLKKTLLTKIQKFRLKNITCVINDRNQLFENIIVVNKIDNKRLNRLAKVRLKFNKMIRNINSAVFAATNKISIDEK